MTSPTRRILKRLAGLLAAVVLLGAAAGLTWWSTTTPRPAVADVGALTVSAPSAGVVYVCPAAPANTIGGVDIAEAQSTTTLTSASPEASLSYAGESLKAGTTSLASAEGGLLTVEQSGEELVGAIGAVTTVTASGDLRGLTSAPCAPPSAVSWFVGGSVAVGSSAELRLTNPGVTVVTAKVRLFGSTGELSLPSNGQVSVPAGQTVGVLLEAAGTADPRMALSVEADGGTLVPFVVTESLDGETAAGTGVISAGAAPSTDLTVPGVVLVEADQQGQSAAADDSATGPSTGGGPVVRLVNPGAEPATVAISLIGSGGEEALPGAGAVVVDPGAVFDVSLAGTAPGTYGVHVTSDLPVGAAVSLVRSAGEYPERSGTLLRDVAWAQAASPSAVEAGAVVIPRSNGITPVLALTNASGLPGEVTVTSLDGSWTQEVSFDGARTVTPTVPEGVDALVFSAPAGQQITAAVVLTAEATGEAPGTLVSVLPLIADADALSQRSIIVR